MAISTKNQPILIPFEVELLNYIDTWLKTINKMFDYIKTPFEINIIKK